MVAWLPAYPTTVGVLAAVCGLLIVGNAVRVIVTALSAVRS